MQVANVLAGYSLSEADVLRRAMSKKKEEILLKEKDKFVNNCVVRNVSKEIANKVYELILKFASFGFNRSHSVAYSMVAYKMAYLKAHYRIFFIKNILNNFISSEDKKKQYVYEARQNNIDVVVPDINNSLTRFEIINNKLIYPLTGIKGIGINACTIILDERKKGKFKDIYDFFKRIYSKSVNRKIIENLIYAGCFDSFNFNRNTLINNLDELINYSEISGGFDDEFNLKPELKIYPELSQRELLIHEYDIFGFYFTKHPVSEYSNNKYIKIKDMDKYFDKYINTVLLVERVKEVNTKNNDKMLFVTGCDEVSSIDIVMFPKIYSLYSDLKAGDVIELNGKVEKRFDKLQLVVSELKHLS